MEKRLFIQAESLKIYKMNQKHTTKDYNQELPDIVNR